jgi:hypothetical protein
LNHAGALWACKKKKLWRGPSPSGAYPLLSG